MEVKEIYWLDELSKEYNDLVGKKCANLGELIRLGLRVPYGFALSVKAYEHFMEATGLKEKVSQIVEEAVATGLDVEQDMGKMMETSAQIRGAIEGCPMPPDLAAEIGRYYSGLQKKVAIDRVACAVRSSGAVSMPGQMETYLNVAGERSRYRAREKGLGQRLYHKGYRLQDSAEYACFMGTDRRGCHHDDRGKVCGRHIDRSPEHR